MRVLLFTEQSKSSRYIESAVRIMRSREIDVAIVTLRGRGALHEQVNALGAPAYALGASSSWEYPLAAVRLLHLMRSLDVDVLHASERIPAAVSGLIPRWASRSKRIFHWHQWKIEGRAGLLTWLGKRNADLVMTCSKAAASLAQDQAGVSRERIRVAYNGIDELRPVAESELAELRGRLGVPADAALVSIVARLRPEKGVDTLIEALPRVQAAVPREVALVVVGDGSEAARLRAKAAEVKEGRIIFAGHQEDVAPWFHASDVVTAPSYHEPFGLSALEAISCRRPVVASAVGGLTEFIEDGTTGTLVPPAEPDALATALIDVLSSPAEAERRAEAAYRSFRARFTAEAMVSGWIDCYRELVEPPGRATAGSSATTPEFSLRH